MFGRGKRSRRAAWLALPLAAGLALTACGSVDASEQEAVDVDDSPATGTIELWAAGGDGAELPAMFEKFQKENPDVEINMTQVPESDFVAKMTAALSSGEVPDLVYLFTEFQPTLLGTGQFQPVPDDLVDEESFFDWAWESTVVDDVAYGVPWYSYARVMHYRSDLAEAAGVTPPSNWDEIKPFLNGLQRQGSEHPLRLNTTPFDGYTAMEFDSFAHQNGGGLISDDLSEWTIDSPENIEALEFFASFVQEGYTDPEAGDQLELPATFTDGRVAATFIGPWFRGWLRDGNGDEWVDGHLGVAAMLEGPDGDRAAMVGGGNWAVPTEAENPESAWKFARWMSEPEQQLEWVEIFGNLPAVEVAWEDEKLASDPNLQPILESLEVGVTVPKVPTWGEVGQNIGEQIERVVRGQASAEEALQAAQAKAEEIGTGE